jgi:hypothetical protein
VLYVRLACLSKEIVALCGHNLSTNDVPDHLKFASYGPEHIFYVLSSLTSPPKAPAAKRPKLALTPNAKIPTKVRQRFLDSFIDEFLKTNPQPEEAYEKVRIQLKC